MTLALTFVLGYSLSWVIARFLRQRERRMRYYMLRRRRAGRDARERAIRRATEWLEARQRGEDLAIIAQELWNLGYVREVSDE